MTGHDLSAAGRELYERCMRIVRVASVFVPETRRRDWTAEWSGELWYRTSLLDRTHPIDRHRGHRLLGRSLPAVVFAV